MSSYSAPRRDGDFSHDPTHESPYEDGSYYGNESEFFENSYNLDEHDPYRDDPTHFSHTDAPSESGHLPSEFDDEYDPSQSYELPGAYNDSYNHNSYIDSSFNDSYNQSSKNGSVYDEYDQSHTGGGDDAESIPESQYTYDTATRRDFKYSTAKVKRHGWCYKFCCIGLLFLIFFIISMAISMLMQKLFFGDDDQQAQPDLPLRDANETFPNDKVFINQVCSSGTIDIDGGARCAEYCKPQFFECCDPFTDFKVLNFTSFLVTTNATLPPEATATVDDEIALLREKNCSLGTELRGCMAYAKCQAVNEIVDPAPANLPHLCGDFGMERDPDSCLAACRTAKCCFDEEGQSCLADNLDICMDYAPCQNLRENNNLLQTAPDTLDQLCFYERPECYEECDKAACCSDRNSRCYQENFMACLTYSPCNNVSDTTTINVPEIFSALPMPPAELIYACDEQQTTLVKEDLETCAKYCEDAACCYEADPTKNCFHDDPLGCMLWHQHCQVEHDLTLAWWTDRE